VETEGGVDVFACDRVGGRLGDLLDVDAALRRHHEDGFARAAVHRDADVELVDEVDARLHEDLLDGVSLEIHPEDRLGVVGRLLAVGRDLDAAGLAASADVDLCFDRGWIADLVDGRERLIDGRREPRLRYRDPGIGEDRFRLVLAFTYTRVRRRLKWCRFGVTVARRGDAVTAGHQLQPCPPGPILCVRGSNCVNEMTPR